MKKLSVLLVGLILGITTLTNSVYCEYCGITFRSLSDLPLCIDCQDYIQEAVDYHNETYEFKFLDGTGCFFEPTE